MSTAMVFIGSRLGKSTAIFAFINVGLVVAWIGFVVLRARSGGASGVDETCEVRRAHHSSCFGLLRLRQR